MSLVTAGSASAQDCGFALAFQRPDERGSKTLNVYEAGQAGAIDGSRPLLFVSSLKVNTDGTAISYHPQDPRARTLAINNILNAMRRGRTISEFETAAASDWRPLDRTWAILSDSVIERDRATGGPCLTAQGYLVSMTSDVAVNGGFNRVGDCDPTKWIDPLTVSSLVLPLGNTEFERRGASNRTPVVAMTLGNGGRFAYGIVGDKGPANELGEASVAMNRRLNGLPDTDRPANYSDAVARFQAPSSAILLFPGMQNRAPRPLSDARVTTHAQALFERWGGRSRLEACLAEIPEAR
ncbi:MAG: hypothetical protein ACK4OJ_01855 [Brevundimonas sp.]